MKLRLLLPTLVMSATATLLGQSTASAPKTNAPKLESGLYDWNKLAVTPTPNGERRMVFDGPTATVDKLHCHISTLKPGERSSAPHRHLQEEIIIVKEGTLEANWDGKSATGGPGSVIFFAAGANTFLRNAGDVPVTYYVLNYFTPLTPKS